MSCFNPIPISSNPPFIGIKIARAVGDGYSIAIDWYQAYSPRLDYQVVYNIYYSTNYEDVFSEGVKFVVTNANQLSATIYDLIPGDVYYFAVRPATMPINAVNLSQLPVIGGKSFYPEGLLLSNITDEDTIISISDVDTFPSFGLIQVGAEIIGYSSVDIPNSELISSSVQRGTFGTEPRMHNTDGYDGYVYRDPIVRHFKGFEQQNTSIMFDENSKSPFRYHVTAEDGYKEKTNIVYTDPDASDCLNENFRKYSYSGYSRTRPEDYLNGKDAGSYFGGEHYCADGYGGVGRRVRGLTFQDQQAQREELLLETYGRPMVLLRRQTSGKVSMHYDNHRENTAYRGFDNHGTDLVLGYEQFFNPSRSDGRILVRFDPTVEDIERQEMGLENKFKPNAWTLPYPILKDGDVLIAFYRDGTPEFRYEVVNVTRNTTFLGTDGRQIFSAVRVRKTDPINQFRVIYDTSFFPSEITTGIGMVDGILPHTHTVTINEGITSLTQINHNTNTAQSHQHVIVNGIIQISLGHQHSLILP